VVFFFFGVGFSLVLFAVLLVFVLAGLGLVGWGFFFLVWLGVVCFFVFFWFFFLGVCGFFLLVFFFFFFVFLFFSLFLCVLVVFWFFLFFFWVVFGGFCFREDKFHFSVASLTVFTPIFCHHLTFVHSTPLTLASLCRLFTPLKTHSSFFFSLFFLSSNPDLFLPIVFRSLFSEAWFLNVCMVVSRFPSVWESSSLFLRFDRLVSSPLLSRLRFRI